MAVPMGAATVAAGAAGVHVADPANAWATRAESARGLRAAHSHR